jgi:multidrug resistance efflux pump
VANAASGVQGLPNVDPVYTWVRLAQRVPVRIAIDEKSKRPLIAGLSTEVTVFTDGRKR